MLNQEQQRYANMLKRVISETKNHKIKTTDELIHELKDELVKTDMSYKMKMLP